MATHRILTVCTRNVCRSPYLAFRIAAEAAQTPDGAEWLVFDRGTTVDLSSPVCEVGARRMGVAGQSFVAGHRSRKVTATDVKAAHLVLTATSAERGAVAQLHPDARSRTFTVREALALGAEPISQDELHSARTAGRPTASLRTYAEILNHRRGTIDVASSRLGLPFLRRPTEPFDIPDWHIGKPSQHEKLFREMDADASLLVRHFQDFLVVAKPDIP